MGQSWSRSWSGPARCRASAWGVNMSRWSERESAFQFFENSIAVLPYASCDLSVADTMSDSSNRRTDGRRPPASPSWFKEHRHTLAQPHLYHLHAAYVALLSGGDEDGDPKQRAAGAPLPIANSIHSRRFLNAIGGGDGGDAAGPSSSSSPSSSSPRTVLPAAKTIHAALQSLPTHWAQHNPICNQCGSVSIPGLTSSAMMRPKASRRARASPPPSSPALPYSRCLLCSPSASHSRSLSPADQSLKDASKAKFPSVRKRKREGVVGRVPLRESPQTKAKPVPIVAEKPTVAARSPPSIPLPSPQQLSSSKPVPETSKPQSPQPPSLAADSKPPKAAAPPTKASAGASAGASTGKKPTPPGSAPAAAPAAKGKSQHTTTTTKQDHKAALRSLLMKDAKKKQSDGGGSDSKGNGAAGGGGLRNFLADL